MPEEILYTTVTTSVTYEGLDLIEEIPSALVSDIIDSIESCGGLKLRYGWNKITEEKINEIICKLNKLIKIANNSVNKGA